MQGPTIVSRTPLADALGAVGVSPYSLPAMVAWSLALAVRARLVFHRVYGRGRGADEWRSAQLAHAQSAARSCRNVSALVDGTRREEWAYVLHAAVVQGEVEAAKVRGGVL